MGHFIVLTAVLGEAYGTTPCAKKILRTKQACVIWTWADYYVWESCDNLWKNVPDAVVVNYRERSAHSVTPEVWLPTNEESEKWRRRFSEALTEQNNARMSGDFV